MGKISGLTVPAVDHAETSLFVHTEGQKYSGYQIRRRRRPRKSLTVMLTALLPI
jgi:hypothetical protein